MDTVLPATDRSELLNKFETIRQQTEYLCQPLKTEDYIPQPITDVSPPRWHLAHTTWFFETFLLNEFIRDYKPFHPRYNFLFNSYYNNIGEKWERARRGDLSRPTVSEIYDFRRAINDRMCEAIETVREEDLEKFSAITLLGLNHEQQHQELLLTDIKYILGNNPLFPAYRELSRKNSNSVKPDFLEIEGGTYTIGYQGEGFYFDNEKPCHDVVVQDFAIMDRLITNGEYLEFMEDRGYENFNYWLDDGWAWCKAQSLLSPLYWHKMDNKWYEMTLGGLIPLDPNQPVTHINFYEAEAFASWEGKRLPTEFEWEIMANKLGGNPETGNFVEKNNFHPVAATENGSGKVKQAFGDAWEWTYSGYFPYPGYRPAKGALGEYNGKFMSNQMVLRGGSCATPVSHFRTSYRNFWHPDKKFQFTGIRLAESI